MKQVECVDEKTGKVTTVMLPDTYQKFAVSTRLPECRNTDYLILGLLSEAGEIAGLRKKWLRGDGDEITPMSMEKELGDVMWYVANIADIYCISLEDIMRTNQKKLSKRKAEGTIRGSGDDR